MVVIKLGKIDRKIIPIIIGCIISLLSRSINAFESSVLSNHPINVILFIAIAKFFNIIPIIIIKIRSKKVHDSDIEKKNKINKAVDLYYKKAIIKNKVKYAYYLLTAIIFFIMSILYGITEGMNANYWVWDILFTSIFSYLIFKAKLYKHHYLSIILIILIGIIIDLIYENMQNDFSKNLLYVFLKVLREVLISLFDVINKYVMETKYCSAYELSFFNGVFDFILIGILEIFDYYFLNIDDIGQFFKDLNGIEFLKLLGVMITQLGIDLCSLITERNYTACHIFIIYVFGQMVYYIDNSWKSLIIFICFFFILIISLIFNEIIELNFCGLSDNIKRNIINRGELEDYNIEQIEHNYLIDVGCENYAINSSELGKIDNDTNTDINSQL